MCGFSHCPSYLKRYISVYIINTINILYFHPVICIVVVCVYVFVGEDICVGAGAHVPWHAWGDQKITFLRSFSLPTLF